MVNRVILKVKEILHYIFHFSMYYKKVILRGVPKILYINKIKFGKNVRINDGVFLHAVNGIKIGDNTTLSYGVSLITESYDISNYKNYIERKHLGSPIIIGDNVWLCAKVIVLPGVRISDNIIVGAGSVVNKDLMIEYSLYAGNPAKFIKRLKH